MWFKKIWSTSQVEHRKMKFPSSVVLRTFSCKCTMQRGVQDDGIDLLMNTVRMKLRMEVYGWQIWCFWFFQILPRKIVYLSNNDLSTHLTSFFLQPLKGFGDVSDPSHTPSNFVPPFFLFLSWLLSHLCVTYPSAELGQRQCSFHSLYSIKLFPSCDLTVSCSLHATENIGEYKFVPCCGLASISAHIRSNFAGRSSTYTCPWAPWYSEYGIGHWDTILPHHCQTIHMFPFKWRKLSIFVLYSLSRFHFIYLFPLYLGKVWP